MATHIECVDYYNGMCNSLTHMCKDCPDRKGKSMQTNLTFELLREKNLERCEKGFKHTLDSWSVAEWGNATAGECGEACNVAKKILRFRDNVAGNKKTKEEYVKELAHELAGTLIYLDLWAASQGINLAYAVIDEFNKKSDEIGSDIKI